MSVDIADLNQLMAQRLAAAAPQAPAEPQPQATPEGAAGVSAPAAAAPPVQGAPAEAPTQAQVDPTAPSVPTQAPPPGPSIEEIQAQLQQLQEKDRLNEERLARYAQMEQTLAAQQRRQQAEQLRQQLHEDMKQTYAQLVDAENDTAAIGLMERFLRRYLEPVQQQAQQQVASYEQLYQQQLSSYTQEVQTILANAFRPGLAREIAAQYQLPEPFAKLLERVGDDQMEQVAADFHNMIAQGQPAAAAERAALQAAAHRQANTFAVAGSPGGTVPEVEVKPMAATSKESLGMLAQIVGFGPRR